MTANKTSGVSKEAVILGVLGLVLLVLIVIFFTGGGEERVQRAADAGGARPGETAAEGEPDTRTVTLFFIADGDDLLHKETREIAAGPTDADEAERALAELVKGSEQGFVSPLPARTRVRQVFIAKDGLATVDFSRDIAENLSYGSTAELAAVYAVVNTLVYNFKPVKKVILLVEGSERETLGGHVDLSRAFFPDYSFVAR
jgi:spore germination protein GerM